MLKTVVVFDSNTGGGIIGDMVENELPVNVIRVNDVSHAPYFEKTEAEIRELTEAALIKYINKVDLIVLAEPEVALTSEEYLKKKYPNQHIVGYGKALPQIIRKERVVRIITTSAVRRTTRYQKMKAACSAPIITESECTKWYSDITEYGTIDKTTENEIIESATAGFSGGMMVIYSSEVLRIKDRIRQRLNWRANVVDLRSFLLRDICKSLGLKGLDGKLKRDLR